MDIRKKFFSIVGVLALTMSMTAGIAAAQEVLPIELSDSKPITIVVNCGPANAGTGSLTLNAGGADSVAFEDFDPSNPATVSTPLKAFRVDLSLGSCPGADWSVTAAISDFTSGENTIAGSHFQLPIGEPNSSDGWRTGDDTPAANVTSPAGTVMFNESGAAEQNLASPNGNASGVMFMEFTAQMFGLDGSVADGTYEAEFTVTFNPSAP